MWLAISVTRMTNKHKPIYKRILLKLSGEAFLGNDKFGIAASALEQVALRIAEIAKLGVEVAVVVGGGNLFRGVDLLHCGMPKVKADQIGMLSSIINSLVLQNALSQHVPAAVFSAKPISGVVDVFQQDVVMEKLQQQHVVLFAGGTGNPLFTTDTAASLRAIEINADIILKATNVDGVYSADPHKDSSAERYDFISYDDVIAKNLQVMDLTAFCLCRENAMPIQVFSLQQDGVLHDIIFGKPLGTMVGKKND